MATIVAKDAALNAVAEHTTARLPKPTKAYTVHGVNQKDVLHGCDKLGHYKRDCRQADETRTGLPSSNGNYKRHTLRNSYKGGNAGIDDPKFHFSLMAKKAEEESLKQKRILDSGATRHMKNNVAALSYRRGASSVVEMGNGTTVKHLKVGNLSATTVVDKEVT